MSAFNVVMVLAERNYKAGYVVREEFIDDREYGGSGLFMKNAYSPSGEWIGNPKTAYYLCKKRGIAPEKSKKKHCVCSIGFSKRLNKFFGWSHRAIVGFAIGDRVFEERFGNDSTKFRKHGKKTIKTRADQRQAAIAFASHVS